MEHTDTIQQNSFLEKIISADDHKQIDIVAKLFNCTFDEALSAVLQTDGTFRSISKRLQKQ